jgi:hypothetical protein
MKRLQGSDWHNVKEDIVIESYTLSTNGNIAVFGSNKFTGDKYYHWLNPEEEEAFDTTKYEEKIWEDQFKKEEK